jgi:cell pole-organizing protein PopZ
MDHIVNAIRRVISEADNHSMEREASKDQISYKYDDGHSPLPVPSTPFDNVGPPVLVEVDDQLDIHSGRMKDASNEVQRSMSASSSLSDDKDQQSDRDQKMQRNYSVDSSVASSIITRSSHNGSGNWGWFEDVHESSRYSKKVKNHNGTHSVPLAGNGESFRDNVNLQFLKDSPVLIRFGGMFLFDNVLSFKL